MRPAVAAAILILSLAVAPRGKPDEVTFSNPCECGGAHGVSRWAAKTDTSPAPTDDNQIIEVAPYQMFEWKPPPETITKDSPRVQQEQDWYALTGRPLLIKVEEDGDIHIELSGSDEKIVAEIPCQVAWCLWREQVFAWTKTQFPFSFSSDKTLELKPDAPKFITVTGKRFYDIDHDSKAHNNRRSYDKNAAVYEIHPIMRIDIVVP